MRGESMVVRAGVHEHVIYAASISRRRSFASRPPAKPVSEPSLPITRWHGATMEIGFFPFAAPTARKARCLPIELAIWP